jgi:hypothetical protein
MPSSRFEGGETPLQLDGGGEPPLQPDGGGWATPSPKEILGVAETTRSGFGDGFGHPLGSPPPNWLDGGGSATLKPTRGGFSHPKISLSQPHPAVAMAPHPQKFLFLKNII